MLLDSLVQHDIPFGPRNIKELRKIKARMLSVPTDYNDVMSDYSFDLIGRDKSHYKLPDQSVIEVPKESRMMAAELLFKYVNNESSAIRVQRKRNCAFVSQHFKKMLYRRPQTETIDDWKCSS